MGYWHEAIKHSNGWVFPARGRKVAVIFQGEDVRAAPFEGHFLRWEGEGEASPMGWKRNPENWIELWPHMPLRASSMEQAKVEFTPLLPQIEDGIIDHQFEKRPYRPPTLPHLVAKIEHPTHLAESVIVQHTAGRYEVRYRVYAPDGRYFPAATPSIGELGWDWGCPRRQTATFADDFASAQQIATVELDEIVQADPEIKRRETG